MIMATNRTTAEADNGSPHDHAENSNIPAEKHSPASLSVEDEVSKALDDVEYPRMTTLCILTIALMLSVFMIGLDTNIIGMVCKSLQPLLPLEIVCSIEHTHRDRHPHDDASLP